ncbi:methyltransferase type 11 [Pseudohyphozyma bogoriensis]|nr:methyltransferase type 11 [Pseudohyphozyma bogoriensis]
MSSRLSMTLSEIPYSPHPPKALLPPTPEDTPPLPARQSRFTTSPATLRRLPTSRQPKGLGISLGHPPPAPVARQSDDSEDGDGEDRAGPALAPHDRSASSLGEYFGHPTFKNKPRFYKKNVAKGMYGGTRKDHRQDYRMLPWWLGWGHAEQDWNSLLAFHRFERLDGKPAAAFNDTNTPRRVLDIGCGPVPSWILQAAQSKGWENTTFVGLDVAPVVLPHGFTTYDVESRTSYVQENFLEGLSFDDNRFDFVRLSALALGIPEHKWNDLIDEVTLARRFINTSPLAVIPSALVLSAKSTTTISNENIPFPLSPPRDSDSAELRDARVLLHAYALRLDGAAHVLSRDLVTFKLQSTPGGTPQPPASPLSPPSPAEERFASRAQRTPSEWDPRVRQKTRAQMEKEVRDAVGDWAEEMVSKSQISALMSSRLGWACAMDVATEDILESSLPTIKERLRAFDAEDSMMSSEEDPDYAADLAFRRSQLALAKREAEIDLRAVRRRLGREETGTPYLRWEDLGKITLQEWSAVAP